jgi:arsenate reductase (thioredoxin)
MKKLICLLFAGIIAGIMLPQCNTKSSNTMPTAYQLNPGLNHYVSNIQAEYDLISSDRKTLLAGMAEYIQKKADAGEAVHLVFICTHNSRRSHMSQLWAQAAAHHYGIAQVHTYSGGTEATAFNPRAVKAMQEAGFDISVKVPGENPVYTATYAPEISATEIFSKQYDHEVNPTGGFAALMTCSHADQNCPFIPGAEARIAIPFDDPKDFDGTAKEEEAYRERCRQIAREIFYTFSQVRTEHS